MKLWFGHGSEHSSNLVMIGRFKDSADALRVREIIERISDQVLTEEREGSINIGEGTDRYPESIRELLNEVNLFTITPAELGQFAYEVTVEVENQEVVLTTDEIDVSAFLKVLIDKGARVEVYSAHHYPGTGHGRGE
jgi:hypothetical protein